MNASYIVYSLAVAWFTYHIFWMLMRIYQFRAFPTTYGRQPNLSLADLADSAIEQARDIPAFNIIVPAYMETDVIEATIYRLASLNYPQTHFQINVVTYADEPVTNGKSTTDIVAKTGRLINSQSGIELVNSLVTPSGFDGFFPGDLFATEKHVSKSRGLNYALRRIHEENEYDERCYFIGKMIRTGHSVHVRKVLSKFYALLTSEGEVSEFICRYFEPESKDYLGVLPRSVHVVRLIITCKKLAEIGKVDTKLWKLLICFIEREAARHYLSLSGAESDGIDCSDLSLHPSEEKAFLFNVLQTVESRPSSELVQYSIDREVALRDSRPILSNLLEASADSESIYQYSRRINSRWVILYDADADAPLDIMRHLAGRIMNEPDTMGFQGPIAPLLNYDSVHPLCRMGALWMAFWHGSAYPRLLHKNTWAHPLAGTNWCFRMEGMEHQKTLIRSSAYDERRRRFLLNFDPRHLTEDLEVGIRNFNEWSINAAWHPIVEMEQVPPTPSAMFRQHTRWALGTLQTMDYIVKSHLPLSQKIWFLLYPVRVLFASSGPFITVGLILAFYAGALIVDPIFSWWSIILIFGNFVYFWAFIETFQRYYDFHSQSTAVDFLYKNRVQLISALETNLKRLNKDYVKRIKEATAHIKNGLKENGFVSNHLALRCADLNAAAYSSESAQSYSKNLLTHTPATIQRGLFFEFIDRFDSILEGLEIADPETSYSSVDVDIENQNESASLELFDDMYAHVKKAVESAGAGRMPRWSKHHTQIVLWCIPFIYFSVTPFFKAFWHWTKGETKAWDKTERTFKRRITSRPD